MIIGEQVVSNCFILGFVNIKEPLDEIRRRIVDLQKSVIDDPYFRNIPSICRKTSKKGFYFHATDDIPEVRKIFFDFINSLDCSFQAVIGRKIPDLYERKHNGKENEFYADLLSHLLKDKLSKEHNLVINVAERGQTTRNTNLSFALQKAIERYRIKQNGREITTRISFNVQNQLTEPILNVADYFCWSVQRVFERGETRYYDYLERKIPLIVDLYDKTKYADWKNYYGHNNKLTGENKINPLSH